MRKLLLDGYISKFNAKDATEGFIDLDPEINEVVASSLGIVTEDLKEILPTDEGFDEAFKKINDALAKHPWQAEKISKLKDRKNKEMSFDEKINQAKNKSKNK